LLLYVFQNEKSFRPTQDGRGTLFRVVLLYVFLSLMKGRLDPGFVLFCAFSGKMVIQKNKNFFNHFHIFA